MTIVESIRSAIDRHLEHVSDLGDGIIRGEMCHDGRAYAVAYFDLSDAVVERASDLTGFQERLLGSDFFSSEGDLRWNSYLYFLAGPNSTRSEGFETAKRRIESDRHFARKFVLAPNDLAARLGEPAANDAGGLPQPVDADAAWSQILAQGSLTSLLDQPVRRIAVQKIESGEAFTAPIRAAVARAAPTADPLAHGKLRTLSITAFRQLYQARTFEFGDVNLIFGANGAGKTSLLEAIEVLYCGRVRRDPDAGFQVISGAVDDGRGGQTPVRSPRDAAAQKVRNSAWYGRADFQGSAISQGFTRFNFLDTDAAFRLSSDTRQEDIKVDLGKLLVGPETSKLWEYLSKLYEELQVQQRNALDRIPEQTRSVQLLESEVARLRSTPSEAGTLLTVYQDGLARLAPEWRTTPADALNDAERARLDGLLQATRRVQAAMPQAPITREAVENRVGRLRGSASRVAGLQAQVNASGATRAEALRLQKGFESQEAEVQGWQRLVQAGVPALMTRIRESTERIARLRRQLREWPGESIPDLASEYAALSVVQARDVADSQLGTAQEQERLAESALSQSLQLEQSLSALRRDLHDTAVAVIERTGEDGVCPVCKTNHQPSELLARLDELLGTQGATAAESLRRGLQTARENVARCLHDTVVIASLGRFADATETSQSTSCGELQNAARSAAAELLVATSELKARENARDTAENYGIDLSGWERLRDATIVPLLPANADPLNDTEIAALAAELRVKATLEASKVQEQNESLTTCSREIDDLLASDLGTDSTESQAQRIATLTRTLRQAEGALQDIERLAETLPISSQSSIEDVSVELAACLLAFDKARHAAQADTQARATLAQKSQELETATISLSRLTVTRQNLQRAIGTLNAVVEQNSLARSTAEAFSSIKDRVGRVFAQIHAPQEYTLGDFNGDSLIVRRDTNRPHAVNQVSTGQRAALALSIFLALNETARSAPPIILIDDPVAHIDDLNTLSFIDYLREVVMRGGRQVFFATADARLAALFQRKFEFLGSDRFKRISLPMAERPRPAQAQA